MSMEVGRVELGRENEAGSDYVQRYLNAQVTIHYMTGGGYYDNGRITYIDTHWVELTKDNGERLLAPVAAVRIIKLPKLGQTDSEADVLLRAADDRKRLGSG